jgi:hypothetical protein
MGLDLARYRMDLQVYEGLAGTRDTTGEAAGKKDIDLDSEILKDDICYEAYTT